MTDSSYSKTYHRFTLDKTPSPSATPPRYGVTYEDHVIPEDRYLGIASSTIKVLDLETKEVLGEMTRYAWSMAAPSAVKGGTSADGPAALIRRLARRAPPPAGSRSWSRRRGSGSWSAR